MIREFNKSSSDDRPGPGICGSKYVEDAKAAHIFRAWGSGTTKRRSPTEGLPGHQQMPGRSWRAGKATAAMESPQALIAALEKGCPLKKSVWMIRESNKSSSDDRPGPGICTSKYVEDEKAAHIFRAWGSGTTKRRSPTELLTGHHQMPGRSWRAGKA